MGERIRRARQFLASKVWPEYATQEWQLRLFRASFDGIWEHDKWLRKQYRKELDAAVKARTDLEHVRGLAHNLVAEIDSILDGKGEGPKE